MKIHLQTAAYAFIFFVASQGWAMAQQPYAGLQARPVKALSDQQMADLKAGRGMGLALAAELNGYPGPIHVLELSKDLALTAEQRGRIERLFAEMKAESIPLGERLIGLETELDQQFATRTITPASLKSSTDEIGAVQGNLRAAHLKYHLLTLSAMTQEQASRYSELRGYGQPTSHRPHGAHQ
jgi:hypothetical protein